MTGLPDTGFYFFGAVLKSWMPLVHLDLFLFRIPILRTDKNKDNKKLCILRNGRKKPLLETKINKP